MNNNDLERFRMIHKVLTEKKESCAFGKAIMATEVKDEDSCNVVVFMGAYRVGKINNIEIESLTYEDDLNATFNRYIDIETSRTYKVPKAEVEDFEESHTVIKRPVKVNSFQVYLSHYNDVKNEFYQGVLENDPEEVVLSLKNSQANE